jgi:ubiquinone/menaquinone biosynthesis C-methylase UbiE
VKPAASAQWLEATAKISDDRGSCHYLGMVADVPTYSAEPSDPRAYTARNDRLYARFAWLYDVVVRVVPVWRRWLGQAVPLIRGPRVLEVSFGTGWLLTQYAGRFQTDGIDLNPALIDTARRNLAKAGLRAELQQGSVEALPYPDATFDTVVNTMAFTGYPDGPAAAAELARVLKPGGRLVLIDINFPQDGNRLGTALIEHFWKPFGDLIRDVARLLTDAGLEVEDHEIGGLGSVHLYRAVKPADAARP